MRFQLDCIFYYVSDLEKAIRFYSAVLGIPLRSRDVVARFDVDGVLFEVVPTDDRKLLQGDGNGRLYLQVADMRKAVAELAHRGIPTTPPLAKPGGILSTFQDPDGNEICLWQYKKGGGAG